MFTLFETLYCMHRVHSNVKTGRKRDYSYRKLQKELQVKMSTPAPEFAWRSDAEVYRNLSFQKPRKIKVELLYYSIKHTKY